MVWGLDTTKKLNEKAGDPVITLADFYAEIARRADKKSIEIDAADVSRVASVLFDVLEDYSAAAAVDLISQGLKSAKERRR